MPTDQRTSAYLLRAVDYRDADRIVTLLTRDLGRIGAIARNARRSRKRFGGKLESFMELNVGLRLGRSDLATLTDATVVRPHMGILSDLRRMRSAGACLELVRLVAPEREPDDRLFEAVGAMLGAMESAEDAPGRGLAFCARALAIIGWTPEIDVCGVSGRRCPEGQAAFFDPRRGTIVSREAGGGPILLAGETRHALRSSFGGDWLTAEWSGRARREAADALRAFVAEHMNRELSDGWGLALGGE